jgi:hypothetical protein
VRALAVAPTLATDIPNAAQCQERDVELVLASSNNVAANELGLRLCPEGFHQYSPLYFDKQTSNSSMTAALQRRRLSAPHPALVLSDEHMLP